MSLLLLLLLLVTYEQVRQDDHLRVQSSGDQGAEGGERGVTGVVFRREVGPGGEEEVDSLEGAVERVRRATCNVEKKRKMIILLGGDIIAV